MTISEKVAYLKGLAEGLKIDAGSDTGKILSAVTDILQDMAYDIAELQKDVDTLNDYADELDSDLGDLEEFIYDDGDDDDEDSDDDDDSFIEVTCPKCGDTIYCDSSIDENDLKCPNCNEAVSGCDCEDDCDCGCECDCDCDDEDHCDCGCEE